MPDLTDNQLLERVRDLGYTSYSSANYLCCKPDEITQGKVSMIQAQMQSAMAAITELERRLINKVKK